MFTIQRSLFAMLFSLSIMMGLGCDSQVVVSDNSETAATEIKTAVVEASCGQCQFGVEEPAGCDLAIRYQGKIYFVDGSGIDDHGDAHGDDGLCNCIRKAQVSGKIVDGRFKAERFEILNDEQTNKDEQ